MLKQMKSIITFRVLAGEGEESVDGGGLQGIEEARDNDNVREEDKRTSYTWVGYCNPID